MGTTSKEASVTKLIVRMDRFFQRERRSDGRRKEERDKQKNKNRGLTENLEMDEE